MRHSSWYHIDMCACDSDDRAGIPRAACAARPSLRDVRHSRNTNKNFVSVGIFVSASAFSPRARRAAMPMARFTRAATSTRLYSADPAHIAMRLPPDAAHRAA
jgi:hypothetical protein